mmetsp:Transcript_85533/g.227239  ORF Transcript_85533/g.227239 Transcript_85533/m.227239 type:complete len:191 (-) Transcript_85533:74-646(-)
MSSHRSGPMTPALSRSASEPNGLPGRTPTSRSVPVKRMDIRGRAAEIVALSYMYAPSSTGSLQHEQLRRMRQVLEDAEEEELLANRSAVHGHDRDKEWQREQLKQQKARHRLKGAQPEEPQWKMRRGKWVYEGGPPAPMDSMTADEALRAFREEEEARGRGTQYRNGVGAPGLMQRFHRRNPSGGFFGDN